MPFLYLGLGVLLGFGLWFLFRPDDVRGLVTTSHPATNYAEAVARIEVGLEQEKQQAIREICHSNLLTHGCQTDHVIVLLHGYTNCPEQFHELGKRFFELGYNVYIPCMPYHGKEDRLTREFSRLTAADLTAYGDQAVDVARGLGRQVTVLGLSFGGMVACWLAQNRADLDLAVPLAAFLRPNLLPSFLVLPFINLVRALPEFTLWWDPRTKEKNPYSPDFAYPQYFLGNLAQNMRLARLVKKQARQKPPLAGQILMVINDFDLAVSNPEIRSLLKIWKQARKDCVHEFHYERDLKLLHDIITPGTPGVPTKEVYRRLVDQVQALQKIVPQPAI